VTEGRSALAALAIAVVVLTAVVALLLTRGLDGGLVAMGTWPFVLWGSGGLAWRALTPKRPLH